MIEQRAWLIPSKPVSALPPIAELIDSTFPGVQLIDVMRRSVDPGASIQAQNLMSRDADTVAHFVSNDQYPMPETSDRAGYFDGNDIAYWFSGLSDFLYLEKLAAQHGIEVKSFFDFACSSGRVSRHFMANRPSIDVYGTDMFANYVQWLVKNFHDRGVFFQNSVTPHIPLEDNSIDLVYGGSIFSHLDEFETAWLMEIKRVLRPGGMAFLTILSDRTWASFTESADMVHFLTHHKHTCLLAGEAPIEKDFLLQPMPAERVIFRNVDNPFFNVHTFLDHKYIRRTWGRIMNVVDIVEKAHGPDADAVVLIKP